MQQQQKLKRKGTIRVVFQNVAQIPLKKYQEKNRAIFEFIHQEEVDVVAMAETNIRWDNVYATEQWKDRLPSPLRKEKSIFAHNIHEQHLEPRQYGGAAVSAFNELSHRVCGREADPSGMGRWSSLVFEGKQGKRLRVVSAYRPCKSETGSSTVWTQQVRALQASGRDIDPICAWQADIATDIQRWKESGETIVIGVDVNDDTIDGPTAQAMSDMGLPNALWSYMGEGARTATQQRNQNNVPIDAIFLSAGAHIVDGGYYGFGEAIPSDHKALWVDLDFHEVLGRGTQPIPTRQPRRLQVQHPKVVQRYNDSLLAEYAKHGIMRRAQALIDIAKSQGWELNDTQETKLNRLILQTNEIKRKAERDCRKLRMGAIEWSPEVNHARLNIRFWTMEVKALNKVKVSSSLRKRLRQQTNLTPTESLEEAVAHRSAAYKKYYAVKARHKELRQEYLVELAQAKQQQGQLEADSALRQLQNREAQRSEARRLRRVLGAENSLTTKVLFTDQAGETHECTEPSQIAEACIRENRRRFSQAAAAPCLVRPGRSYLNKIWSTETSSQVLRSDSPPPAGMDEMLMALLGSLHPIPAPQDFLSVKDHTEAWTKQTERVSSEPANPHFGHYKAAAQCPALAAVDMQLREIPYQCALSPTAWRRITDVQILKKAQVYNIEKMRTIQLMDAQFNLNNKRLGRDMMATAESSGWLSEYQFGSRKGMSAIVAALNKRLSLDIAYQKKAPVFFCSNDAKSCYDRIVPNFAAAAMMAAGANPSAVRSMFDTLQRAEHYVSTAYGVSSESYAKDHECLMHGIGQGNGAGPAIWAVISSVMFRAMQQRGHETTFRAPLSRSPVRVLGSAFVDDTDLVHISKDGDEAQASLQSFRRMINDWNGLLTATGGAIVPSKSAWWAVEFSFSAGQWWVEDSHEQHQINISDGQSGNATIPRKLHTDPVETLGVSISLDGNNSAQVSALRKKSEVFAEKLRVAQVTPREARTALILRFMKSVEYVMAATQLTPDQWRHIMAPALQAALPKMKLMRTFPRTVLFAPVSAGGIGVPNPWRRQVVRQVQALFQEVHASTPTGRMMEHSIEALKDEVGVDGSLFDHPHHLLQDALTPCWISNLWGHIQEMGFHIQERTLAFHPQREGDRTITELALGLGYHGQRFRRLNACRLQLGAVYISDIATACGSTITSAAWSGHEASTSRESWPRLPARLPASWWAEWGQFCRRLTRSDGSLLESLGPWYLDEHRWRWWHHPPTDTIFDVGAASTVSYRRTSGQRRTRRVRYHPVSTSVSPPEGAVRISVTRNDRYITWEGTSGVQMSYADIPYLEPERHPYIHSVEGDLSPQDAHGAATAGALVAVSDGSFKDGCGTSASIIYDTRSKKSVSVLATVPGSPPMQSSYRSELMGILASLIYVFRLEYDHDVVIPSITLALDGQQALNRARDGSPRPTQRDWDLLSEIEHAKSQIQCSLKWRWVKGHQDDSSAPLDMWARLNVRADAEAKRHWELASTSPAITKWVMSAPVWRVGWSGAPRSHVDSATMESVAQQPDIDDYWRAKHGWSESDHSAVDWTAYARARRSTAARDSIRFITKVSTGFIAVGRKMKQAGLQADSVCPGCQQEETVAHLLTCGEYEDTWDESVTELLDYMNTVGTNPLVVGGMRQGMRRWRRKVKPVGPQRIVGWFPLLQGFLHVDWRRQQAAWMKDNPSKHRTAEAWAADVIRRIWKIPWAVWTARNNKVHEAPDSVEARTRDYARRLRSFHPPGLTLRETQVLQRGGVAETGTQQQVQQWIELAQRVRKDARDRQRRQSLQQERSLMAAWLSQP